MVNTLPRPFLVGMVHLGPLPGSPRFERSMAELVEAAVRDAQVLERSGFHALMVENYGDVPFYADRAPAETVAGLAVAAAAVRAAVRLPIGVNVLRNDALAGLGLAAVVGASFIRVNVLTGVTATDQGLIEGRAAEVLRARARLCPGTAILADVHVKHGRPLGDRPIAVAARDTAYRALADGIIVSGESTGAATDVATLREVREAVPDRMLLVGSGATADSAAELLTVADGIIVGTSIKVDGISSSPVDEERARRFVAAAGK